MLHVAPFPNARQELRVPSSHRPWLAAGWSWLWLCCCACCGGAVLGWTGSSLTAEEAQRGSQDDFQRSTLVLQQYCGDCHGGGASEGGFAWEILEPPESLQSEFHRWQTARQRIRG